MTSYDENEYENSLIDHSFDNGNYHHQRDADYMTTTLISSSNITLADVNSEVLTTVQIQHRISMIKSKCIHHHNPLGVIDPRAYFKYCKTNHPVDSLVDYDEISKLATQADDLMKIFL